MGGVPNGFPEPAPATDLRWYVGVLWRRKLVILPLLIVLPLVAYLRADPGEPTYDASATVLLNRQSQSASELSDPSIFDPGRTIRTQAQLARLPEVATRVVDAAALEGHDAAGFLASSSVSSDEENDFLVFHVRDPDPDIATRLANLYATKYIGYRRELDTQSLREALGQLSEELGQLKRQGVAPTTNSYQSLITRQQQLKTAETLQASKSLLVRPADGAGLVAPQQGRRAILLAFGLGLILTVGLAFIVEALDTRVRSVDDLVKHLGLPILGTIPAPARRLRRKRSLVMLDEPNNPAAEPYRMLRASLELVRPADCRLVMVTSAVEAEGKSTTAANLAVAMARAGQHVVLLDIDLYRPGVERWFRLPPGPGLTEVASGKIELEDAVRPVPLRPNSPAALALTDDATVASLNGHRRTGKLELLTRGSPPESPGEFIATPGFEDVLEQVRQHADVVIVDGPPLLLSGDGLTLSSRLDALLVVARVNVLEENEVQELGRVLSSCPAAKLGLVATGAAAPASGYYYRHRVREVRQPQRQIAD